MVDSFKQFAQNQLKNEQVKLNESFEKLKKQIEVDNINARDEVARNVDDMKSLVNQNNSKLGSFITKDV